MFAMGDRVVYPLHGGAIIKDIEAHIQDGETVKYYILQMLFDNMIVSVPVENAEKLGLRYIGDDETLAIIQKASPPLLSHQSKRGPALRFLLLEFWREARSP